MNSHGKNNLNNKKKTTNNTSNKNDTKNQELMESKDKIKHLECQISDLEMQNDKLLKDMDELEKQNENIQKEKNDLEDKIKILEEKNEKTSKSLKDCQTKAQKKEDDLKNKVDELTESNKEFKECMKTLEKEIGTYSEGISTPFSNIYMKLYSREGQLSGAIIHPLTKDTKSFSGIDQDIILNFISNHLPKEQEPVEVTAPAPHFVSKMVPVTTNISSQVLSENQPFPIMFKLDLTGMKIAVDSPLKCNIKVFAKPIGIGSKKMIAELQNDFHSTGVFDLSTFAQPLREGTYKFETVMTSKLPNGRPAPFSAFLESGLVFVN